MVESIVWEVEHPLRERAHDGEAVVAVREPMGSVMLPQPLLERLARLRQRRAEFSSESAGERAQLREELEVSHASSHLVVGLAHEIFSDVAEEVHVAGKYRDGGRS